MVVKADRTRVRDVRVRGDVISAATYRGKRVTTRKTGVSGFKVSVEDDILRLEQLRRNREEKIKGSFHG